MRKDHTKAINQKKQNKIKLWRLNEEDTRRIGIRKIKDKNLILEPKPWCQLMWAHIEIGTLEPTKMKRSPRQVSSVFVRPNDLLNEKTKINDETWPCYYKNQEPCYMCWMPQRVWILISSNWVQLRTCRKQILLC